MSVERGADVVAGSHRREQLLHPLGISLAPGFSRRVETVERAALRILPLDPLCRQRLGDEVEDFVGPLDCRGRLGSHLLPQRDPRSDDGERAASCDQVFGWKMIMNMMKPPPGSSFSSAALILCRSRLRRVSIVSSERPASRIVPCGSRAYAS